MTLEIRTSSDDNLRKLAEAVRRSPELQMRVWPSVILDLLSRIAALEAELTTEHNQWIDGFKQLQAEADELREILATQRASNHELERLLKISDEQLHYSNGVADLAIKHRNTAESQLTLALFQRDRAVEALRRIQNVTDKNAMVEIATEALSEIAP